MSPVNESLCSQSVITVHQSRQTWTCVAFVRKRFCIRFASVCAIHTSRHVIMQASVTAIKIKTTFCEEAGCSVAFVVRVALIGRTDVCGGVTVVMRASGARDVVRAALVVDISVRGTRGAVAGVVLVSVTRGVVAIGAVCVSGADEV